MASDGIEKGDCSFHQDRDLDEGGGSNERTTGINGTAGNISTTGTSAGTDLQNNAIKTGLDVFGSEIGLGAGIMYLIVIALMVFGLAIILARNKIHGLVIVIVEAVFLVLAVIIGGLLGFISLGIIIIISLLLILGGAVWFSKAMHHSGS